MIPFCNRINRTQGLIQEQIRNDPEKTTELLRRSSNRLKKASYVAGCCIYQPTKCISFTGAEPALAMCCVLNTLIASNLLRQEAREGEEGFSCYSSCFRKTAICYSSFEQATYEELYKSSGNSSILACCCNITPLVSSGEE